MIDFRDVIAAGAAHINQIVAKGVKIAELRHPTYEKAQDNWVKWRLTYESGDDFITKYLQKFSKREGADDFVIRKSVTYVPAFAKGAVSDVKDSIFQRISDVTRDGGPTSYTDAVAGKTFGVDRKGSTMNSYMGRHVLPELLSMGRVGIFVDMPQISGPTLVEKGKSRPYIYHYKTEDICNWVTEHDEDNVEFASLLLRDFALGEDVTTGLPSEQIERYRYLWRGDNCVFCQFFDKESNPISPQGEPGVDVQFAPIPSIPFTLFTVFESLMTDIANYQIALLNMASSDVSYALRANFPFYVEQFDPKSENFFNRSSAQSQGLDEDGITIVRPGQAEDAETSRSREIAVGAASGRRIPRGLDMPEFIHPSPEPLMASMKKQEELKRDIRHLVKLAVSAMAPKMASAESKGYDERSLEAGLSAIGLELEQGERNMARFWTMYEDLNGTVPTVRYPTQYSLRTDSDRRDEAEELRNSMKNNPSMTYQREALKQIVTIDLAHKISEEKLAKMHREIDAAPVIFSDPDVLKEDIEAGLIDLEAASKAKNYPSGSVAKAKEDHAERIARIAESQGQARGTPDLGGIQNASKNEKQDKTLDDVPKDTTRGEGK